MPLVAAVSTAQAIHVGWIVAASLMSGVVGGFVGAFVVGFRIGAWRQRVDSRFELVDVEMANVKEDLTGVEKRLSSGDDALAYIPALDVQVKGLTGDLMILRREIRNFVTREECHARHEAR